MLRAPFQCPVGFGEGAPRWAAGTAHRGGGQTLLSNSMSSLTSFRRAIVLRFNICLGKKRHSVTGICSFALHTDKGGLARSGLVWPALAAPAALQSLRLQAVYLAPGLLR